MIDKITSEENKTIVGRVWEEFFIRGNLGKADEFLPPTTSTMIPLRVRIGMAPRN